MSPVFGHGRLRLYLLKLLEESPRHGYEVIRLLQDRFLGVYSPSPGTIYPRLARLEEEGLVTREVVKGKKVYSLTDKGRAELERRMDELADLEDEITASAQEFAREVQEDVRDTVRSLREELTQAARDMREQGRPNTHAWKESARRHKEEWRRTTEGWKEHQRALKDEWRRTWEDAWTAATGDDGARGQMRLDRLLRKFTDDVHHAAAGYGDRLDDESLAAARDLLTETVERMKTEIFRRPDA
ncbi:MAG TPA: helix-turn-helix transcriptional regulator [Streptosporangiaceae bacterium]|nr:helix-turn-helix transcriptional regulator [Streptosporangiaceae bacterium]